METKAKPRIGILGSGAIGGFYGVKLANAGFDVHFLVRSEYDEVRARGFRIDSAVHGPLVLQPAQVYRDASQMPACDWLLIGTKTTANAELVPSILSAAANGAKIVLMQNGLEVEDGLRPHLPPSLHLLGGLCFICVQRRAPGVIEHQALGAVNLAYHSGPASDDASRQALVEEGAALFRAAGLDSTAMADLHQARWQKLVWNLPYNGLSVLLGSGTAALMADVHSRALVEDLMDEVVRAAGACGQALPQGYAGKLMAATERMPDYLPSMYHDFVQHRPLELPALYEAPLAAAARAGCDMPKARALYQALRFLDARGSTPIAG